MTKTTRIFSAVVVAVLLLSALGCGGGGTGRSALYGKWDMTDSGTTMTWEFKADGSFTLGSQGISIDTKYEFVDDDTIKITAPADIGGDDLLLDFKVNGDSLTLSSDGEDQVLTRSK